MLVNVKNNVVTYKEQLKLKIASLTLKDCEVCPQIRKYFRNGNTDLDRFHIPEISAEKYAEIAKSFKRTSRFNEANLKLETATDYYIKKARVQALADELGVKPSFIDLTDYTWNEDWYTVFNTMRQADVIDDAWRENEDDYREWSANKIYLELDAKHSAMDYELFDTLHKFCYNAIISRKAMLLCKVDKCLGFLNSLIDYTNGFSENVTGAQIGIMKSYLNFFTELLENEEARAWIEATNDIEVFGNNEALHNDYVETYRGMLRGLVRGGSLEDFRSSLSHIEDPYLDEILADVDNEVLSDAYLKDVEA